MLDGCLVGAMEGATFEAGELQLAAGDALVMFTDGVVEATDADERFSGDPRLAAELADLRDASREQIVAAVRGAVERFAAGAPQSDDLTLPPSATGLPMGARSA